VVWPIGLAPRTTRVITYTHGHGEKHVMRKFSAWGSLALALAVTTWTGAVRAQEAQTDLPGPIDSLDDLQDTGRMLFRMADANHDGQISQQEAINGVNQMVGGPFFRADQDGNGALSQEELRSAREAFMSQRPLMRILLQRARAQAGQNNTANQAQDRARNALSLIDTNNDGQVQSTELRQLVTTSVQSGFASADTNRDGQLTPTEINAAMVGAARAAAQAAFQQADTDNNGQLSQAEYDKAIVQPAHAVFGILDINRDNQLSQQEIQAAQRVVVGQLRRLALPEAPNSPRNMIQSGRTPAETAPVPTFATPVQPGTATGTLPAPAPAPTTVAPPPGITVPVQP
jgi:hypothetical protein